MNILDNKMTVLDFISLIGGEFPLLSEYKNTEQDKLWHSEGDVEIHTNMVIDEAYSLIQSENIGNDKAKILVLAALFHDYGKPLCTKPVLIDNKERIGAQNHEEFGASRLLFIDPPFDLSQADWMRVIQLVAYHHFPKRLVIKNMGRSQYTKLSRQVKDIDLLYYLEVADMKGRTCEDKDKQLEIMDVFQMFAIDYNIWNEDPYKNNLSLVKNKFPELVNPDFIANQMASRYEDNQIHMLEEELSRAYGYKETQSHLVVFCGLPGAGKSTYIKDNLDGYEIVSLDKIRESIAKSRSNQDLNDEVVRVAHEQLKSLLREKKNIVWDATNFRKDFRGKICAVGFNYKAYVEIVFLHKPLSMVLKQNKSRTHVVPMEAIIDQVEKFQIPDVDEAHQLTIVS